MHLRHRWTIKRAIRECDCRWSGAPLGDDVRYVKSKLPRGPHLDWEKCAADIFEECGVCLARRSRTVKQPSPPLVREWEDLGILPEGRDTPPSPPPPPPPPPPRSHNPNRRG